MQTPSKASQVQMRRAPPKAHLQTTQGPGTLCIPRLSLLTVQQTYSLVLGPGWPHTVDGPPGKHGSPTSPNSLTRTSAAPKAVPASAGDLPTEQLLLTQSQALLMPPPHQQTLSPACWLCLLSPGPWRPAQAKDRQATRWLG